MLVNISWDVVKWEGKKKIVIRFIYFINKGIILEYSFVIGIGIVSVECVLSYFKEVEVFIG